jgi:hypothetical protein
MTKTKHADDEVEAPESKTAATKADAPTQLLNPLYNYGNPTTVSGNPANGGSPAVNTGVVVSIAGGSNHVPPTNTAAVVVVGGSPSEEMGALYLPTLASISPTTVVHGVANAVVTCTGTNFFAAATGRPGTTVMYGNDQLATTFVSATSVTAIFPHLTAPVGTVSVNVRNAGAASTTPRTFTYT